MAKRIFFGLSGLLCVLFIVSLAQAGPKAKRGRSFEKVGRNGVTEVRHKTMRTRADRTRRHRRTRAPRQLTAPRQYGDLHGQSARHQRARTRSSSLHRQAGSPIKAILNSRIKQRVRCPDGVNCGVSMHARARNNDKANKSFLRGTESQRQQYMQKRFEIRMKNQEPVVSRAMHGPCSDAAECL